MFKDTRNSGFTMVELMVSIAIITIMSTVVLASLNVAREQARDTIRIADLSTIAKGLAAYEIEHEQWLETGTGCGFGGNGTGWFSHTYPGFTSMSECLANRDYIESPITDPSGATTNNGNHSGYMKYHCGTGDSKRVYLYAQLERLPQDSTATDGTCCPDCDSNYGMNYFNEIAL